MSPPESNCNRDIYKQYKLIKKDTVASNFVLVKNSSSFTDLLESMSLLSRPFLPVELTGFDPS